MTENQPANHEKKNLSNESKELLLSLPKKRGWISHHEYQYQGFWCPSTKALQAIVNFQKHFQARDFDIVVTSLPQSGTTWLKALKFAVVNRHRFDINNQVPDFSSNFIPEPRLFATHIPFPSLGTVKESNCKIVYFCRNPFDTFVSYWHFVNKVKPQSLGPLSLDETFDRYCQGTDGYGPFWDHILGYWRESLKRPNMLFLKYEDMKKNILYPLKTLAKFIDYPFAEEEERNGVIEDIAKLCSFDTIKKLEVNKFGTFFMNIENNNLFRKAKVGLRWRRECPNS